MLAVVEPSRLLLGEVYWKFCLVCVQDQTEPVTEYNRPGASKAHYYGKFTVGGYGESTMFFNA